MTLVLLPSAVFILLAHFFAWSRHRGPGLSLLAMHHDDLRAAEMRIRFGLKHREDPGASENTPSEVTPPQGVVPHRDASDSTSHD
jgi:hypothetical protein